MTLDWWVGEEYGPCRDRKPLTYSNGAMQLLELLGSGVASSQEQHHLYHPAAADSSPIT